MRQPTTHGYAILEKTITTTYAQEPYVMALNQPCNWGHADKAVAKDNIIGQLKLY